MISKIFSRSFVSPEKGGDTHRRRLGVSVISMGKAGSFGGTFNFILVFTFVFLARSLAEDTLCADHDFYLDYPSRSMVHSSQANVIGSSSITAFTICLWFKTGDPQSLGLLSSLNDVIYLAIHYDNSEQLRFGLRGQVRTVDLTGLSVRDDEWHGLCVTWENSNGEWMVFFDGRLLEQGESFEETHTLTAEIFVLGKVTLPSFDNYYYYGHLGHVNVWSHVLERPLLAVLSSRCTTERGTLISWPQFKESVTYVFVVNGETCPSTVPDVPNLLQHWTLDGGEQDKDLTLHHSATFLEGRLDGHKALYLDQTEAYVTAPMLGSFSGLTGFTMACWIKTMSSDGVIRGLLQLRIAVDMGFHWEVDEHNHVYFKIVEPGPGDPVVSGGEIKDEVWHHVGVKYDPVKRLELFVDGKSVDDVGKVFSTLVESGTYEIGRVSYSGNLRYFHGFISDFYVFGRPLTDKEIGTIMGRSLPCTFTKWSPPPNLPVQTTEHKTGTLTCPGVGECKDERPWKPADCREALLSGNKTSAVYIISPQNNDEEFDVFCDQETHGGGWILIQQRVDGSLNFDTRTWDEYKNGFGSTDGHSEMWLGNNKIHDLTSNATELLIELEAIDGRKGYALYKDFLVGSESENFKLSIGAYSGTLPDKLRKHDGKNFTTIGHDNDKWSEGNCQTFRGGGWWFEQCGPALLNSRYGSVGGAELKWEEFPDVGDMRGEIRVTKMKIRSTKVYSGDYILRFSDSEASYLRWPNILSDIKAFTVCLWLKVVNRKPERTRVQLLMNYVAHNGNFSLRVKATQSNQLVQTIGSHWNKKGPAYPPLDGTWHHVCVTWSNNPGLMSFVLDGIKTTLNTDIGAGQVFSGGGYITVGNPPQSDMRRLFTEMSYMNVWDRVLPENTIRNLADECGVESGNILQWSSFAGMAEGAVQLVQTSLCIAKELYSWNFDNSTTMESFDAKQHKSANITSGWISADRRSLVIEDNKHFFVDNISSELTSDSGFTVQFSMRQTALTSDIIQDNIQSLEALRAAFPDFIRDHAVWKRCYSAGQQDWRTTAFHSSCDFKGPTLTVIRVRRYVFGGFVEQSWGGPSAYIGNQAEAFLFSLSNPLNKAPKFLPINQGHKAAFTDPDLGPSFGNRDLELFQDANGKLTGFSGLGSSGSAFNYSGVPLSFIEARSYFMGSQYFNPDLVEVFYYHVPSNPIGLENKQLADNSITASSSSAYTHPYLARLNENRVGGSWCTSGAGEWLQVNLGKQYTVTHIAMQRRTASTDVVTGLTVRYVKTKDTSTWIPYEKHDGFAFNKIIQFNLLPGATVVKEAFVPPFEAASVQLQIVNGTCMNIELYFFDAGCLSAYGMEDGSISDDKITASSFKSTSTAQFYWPIRGRLNNVQGGKSWGPKNISGAEGIGSWLQVDLQGENEITCVATQGRPDATRYPEKYKVAVSSEGIDWSFYEKDGEEKELTGNSDQHIAVTDWLVPSVRGRFIRIYLTDCRGQCKLRAELYGNRNSSEIYMLRHGLGFTVRRGQYHVFFAKNNKIWEIRHPLIVNEWFVVSLTWNPNDGLKFYGNGELLASDRFSEQLPGASNNESFKLMIGSAEDGGGWSRSISIDDVSVRKTTMSQERVHLSTEVHLNFDDASRNWTSLLTGSNWMLTLGCTGTEGTGPCNDTSGTGRYIYYESSYPRNTGDKARFVTPVVVSSYQCVRFHFHMSGADVGRLNVYTADLHGNEELVWSVHGDQNNTWNEARFPVTAFQRFKVIFEAVRGSGYLGDIAVDDIVFVRDNCSLSPSLAATSIPSGVEIKSSIIRSNTMFHQHLRSMLQERHDGSRWRSCYHALTDGWNVSTFHQRCDDKGPTVTIVRKDNYVFGGFTERSWKKEQTDFSYDLYFWRRDILEYVSIDWPPGSAIGQFTVGFWIKTLEQNVMNIFSSFPPSTSMRFQIKSQGTIAKLWLKPTSYSDDMPLHRSVSDGFWHHIALVVWISADKSCEVFVDGISEGRVYVPWSSNHLPSGGKLVIGQKLKVSSDASNFVFEPTRSFQGRITLFNIWDHVLNRSTIHVLARGCTQHQGNVILWENLWNKTFGQLWILQPSSCSSRNYHSDPNAAIFSFNYTSEGALFLKNIRDEAPSVATYSSATSGPTFGEAPFDLQIGIDGNMRDCSSHHIMSYTEEQNSPLENLVNVLAGAPFFIASDIEVLYRTPGGALCVNHCPYNHHCDEITGDCHCRWKNSIPGLCQLADIYKECTHFWPLDAVENIEDLGTPGWGRAEGNVSVARGLGNNALFTDGISGEVQLNTEGTSCATKKHTESGAACVNNGFTVALWIKPWIRDDGQRQVFFRSLETFFVYQAQGTESVTVYTQVPTHYCLKEFITPKTIWSHLAFTYQSSSHTLTVYRNGDKIEDFVRDDGCNVISYRFSAPSLSLSPKIVNHTRAKAAYDDIGIWDSVLPEARIAEIYRVYTELSNLSVAVTARLVDQDWHDDLKSTETERYKAITNDLVNNVTNFYSRHSGLHVRVVVNEYRPGSVVADFHIIYNTVDYSLIEELQNSISTTGRLDSMRLELIHFNQTHVPSEAPSNLTPSHVTATCINITWNQPSLPAEIWDNFQGYMIYIRREGTSEVYVLIANTADNFTTLEGLNQTTTYNISIAAYTLSGVGKESDIIAVTTLQFPVSPPPTAVKAYNTSSTSVVVEWQALPPEEVIGNLLGYEVRFKPRSGNITWWSSRFTCANSLNATITSLEKYTEYDVGVATLTSSGLGNSSSIVSCFTDEDIPEGGPTNITAHNTSSTSIYIQWSPVPQHLRLGVILQYIFNLTEVLDGNVTQISFDGGNLSGEVRNLSKYTEYIISGAAVNSKGQSNFTNSTTCRTDEDAPDFPPANVKAYNSSSTSIIVEFQAYSPEQANGIIRKYNIHYVISGQSDDTKRTFGAIPPAHNRRRRATIPYTVVTAEVKGLEVFTTYSIQVSVVTIKEGPVSTAINVSTDEGVPRGLPLQLTAYNTSASTIMVRWLPINHSDIPGTLLGYEVRFVKADDSNASNYNRTWQGLMSYKHLTHLDAYTLYNISVAGFTRTGNGNFSVTQCWTDESLPVGPPNNVSGSPTSLTSITVSWLPVTKHLRMGRIQGYIAQADDFGRYTHTVQIWGAGLSAVISGLQMFTNYSVQVLAFTSKGAGPWSSPVIISSGAPAPEKVPMNSSAEATSSTSIHVTWSGISVPDPRFLHGYRVKYQPTNNPSEEMSVDVNKHTLQANLTLLRPFTVYSVQVAAFSTAEGNYSEPVFTKTWEDAPSAPPSQLGVAVQNSHALLVHWLDVPADHQNGVIRGYRVTFWEPRDGRGPVITVPADTFSLVLAPLRKATTYQVEVWAFTNAGEGSIGYYSASTGEDAPSRAPTLLTAQNQTSLTGIPVSWEPVPAEYMHGRLVGYLVTYQAVMMGDLLIDDEPVFHERLGPVNYTTLWDLEPLVVYRITVAAMTNRGPGPEAVTFGETCRCLPRLTTNWRNYSPYVNLTSPSNPGIIIPLLLDKLVHQCCGHCIEHGRSVVDFEHNGKNQAAEQRTDKELLKNIGERTDFSFPVIGHKLQDSYKGGLGYAPFVESAGVAFVVFTDTSGSKQAMFRSILECWPIILLPVVMAYMAGVFLWCLDANSDNPYFSGSFLCGTWEGVWWSFVSMTTVGYGDRTPISHLGRVFAIAWVLMGLVIISLTMGALTTALTTITVDSEPTIYGSKIGAIQNSPEYNLGVRRNGIVNKDKEYQTLEELSEAVLSREVDGILVDTYAGGTRKELFAKPSLRVAKVIDYQTAYGVVIGGPSMRLRHCFYGYMRAHQADIFQWVEELVEPMSGPGPSEEDVVQDISTGLFDSDSQLFKDVLLITCTSLVAAVVLGLLYEVLRRMRGRAKIKEASLHKEVETKQLRTIVEDFLQHLTSVVQNMKAKHKKEILQLARCSVKEDKKNMKSAAVVSSTLGAKSEISTLELDDRDYNTRMTLSHL